ncbi:hypothetical protein A4R63_01975 [Corynebacterium pseudotuberculosis]|uniref:Uncharacterized protein n=1 Tax=Corynebacterium pseudotuberculosis 258 TaxID=1168865 RepID=A0AAU8PK98_CORPS|nr:hypothetical protein CPCIP5297_02015 [Corynebacterium pseudotuberculosis CIP 52.97]AFK16021.1 hypothetical protein CP258_02015 [Corynebacterium pseudotuberculosis 258]AFM06735.1 hypothetical protein CP162_02050 [Corynebacterium pseudotuberculosis Cp162]AKN59632.1 hypothetical protein CP31_02230 [Corynebacterium pseudotuberculosis 31]AKP08044.1 Hypothetical protein Cp262_0376 [Corynebacterium pseudotuberculosis]
MGLHQFEPWYWNLVDKEFGRRKLFGKTLATVEFPVYSNLLDFFASCASLSNEYIIKPTLL